MKKNLCRQQAPPNVAKYRWSNDAFCSLKKDHDGQHVAYSNHDPGTGYRICQWANDKTCDQVHPNNVEIVCTMPRSGHNFHVARGAATWWSECGAHDPDSFAVCTDPLPHDHHRASLPQPSGMAPHVIEWANNEHHTPVLKEDPMTTTKTYQVSKLLKIVRDWNAAVADLTTTLDEYNHEREKLVAERMASYLAHGTYQDDDGNTVDDSTKPLEFRIGVFKHLYLDKYPSLHLGKAAHSFATYPELQLQLETLDGKTVEMTNDEVEVIHQLADTTPVEEMRRKYA